MAKEDKTLTAPVDTAILAVRENTANDQTDDFWFQPEIEGLRWNKNYPYQLLGVYKNPKDGTYSLDGKDGKWKFTLPFAPQALSYSMPFAINVSSTLDGIIEEHGGVPFRLISFSSTTGVLPLKGSAETQNPNLATGIFTGTVTQARRVGANALQAVSNFTNVQTPNLVPESSFSNDEAVFKATGYYQALLLRKFLENYAILKRNGNTDLNLALAIWKERAVYLITPVDLKFDRTAASPFEYPYTLIVKAWKRINLDNQPTDDLASVFTPATRNANAMDKILKSLQDSRRVLAAAKATLLAINNDFERVIFKPVRETIFFTKDILNAPITLMDASSDFAKNVANNVLGLLATTLTTGAQLSGGTKNLEDEANRIAKEFIDEISGQLKDVNNLKLPPGIGRTSSAFKKQDFSKSVLFTDPEKYYDFFNNINPASLDLTPQQQGLLTKEKEAVRELKRDDFERIRNDLVKALADICDSVGASDETYSRVYNRTSVVSNKTPSSDDFQIIFALNNTIMALDQLALSGEINRFQTNKFDFVSSLATRSGIAFTTPVSKFAVPFPFGATLEQVSQKYLGSPDRYFEIITLNGLQPPYIDEIGFDYPLLINGNGNQIEVASDANLHIGQPVWLSSTGAIRTRRHIVNIKKVSPGQVVLTLDGEPDLDIYDIADSAFLHAFLPGTINSGMLVFIPSSEPSNEEDFRIKDIPGVDFFDPLARAGGVDFLLTQSNNLAVTPDGDVRLAIGLTNIIQLARIKLSIFQGTLNRHPTFGLPIKIGQSTAETDANQILQSLHSMFSESPFDGIKFATVNKLASSISIVLSVAIKGFNQLIPLEIEVPFNGN